MTQLSWGFILRLASQAKSRFNWEDNVAGNVAQVYYQSRAAGSKGTILMPEDRPPFTYLLAYKYQVPGSVMLSQMYDPFFYFKEDPFTDWSKYRPEIMAWIKSNNIQLVIVFQGKKRYTELIAREPEMFILKGNFSGVLVYEVKPI